MKIGDIKEILPTGDNILVRPISYDQTESAGGIIIPGQKPETSEVAEVLEVGPDVEDKRIKKGMMILYKRFKGIDVQGKGREMLFIVQEEGIIGIVK
jgi:co-chaperonin GroES (HSP10)